MEDYTIILYALAAVVYFIYVQWRKAFSSPSEEADVEVPHEKARPPHPNRPATSFEDILRELQPKLERAEEKGKSIVESAKEQAKQVAGPLVPAVNTYQQYRSLEADAQKALSWEKAAEARQLARQSNALQKRLFLAEETEVKTVSKYAKLLHNPNAAREAFVLTEIFKRKFE